MWSPTLLPSIVKVSVQSYSLRDVGMASAPVVWEQVCPLKPPDESAVLANI